MISFKKSDFLTVLTLLLIYPAVSHSQMFSVEEPERRARPATNTITFGLDFVDMNLRPDNPDISNIYNFNEPIYRLRLDFPGIEVYAGYRTGLGDTEANADTLNYLNLGANISGAMPVSSNRRMGVLLPIWLSTDFTQAKSSQGNQPELDQFRKSSISVGIGGGGFVSVTSRIRVRAELVPQIGITVTSLGSDTGQMGSVNGRVRMLVDQIVGRFGFAAGYNFNWRRYTGGDEQFHYDISSHSVTIGFSF